MPSDADLRRDEWRLQLVRLAELKWGSERTVLTERELAQMADALARVSARAPMPETMPGSAHG